MLATSTSSSRSRLVRANLALATILLLVGCGATPKQVVMYGPDEYPDRLSAWQIVEPTNDGFTLATDSEIYSLNTPLFTDYALKLRTIHFPSGQAAKYQSHEAFNFPVGTIISKTFFYLTNPNGKLQLDAQWNEDPATLAGLTKQVVETRLLVRQSHGWDALPYVWRDGDAYLSITGDLLSYATQGGGQAGDQMNYIVPSRNECASCHASNHTTGAIKPLGLKARHINRADPVHGQNQLTNWQSNGTLAAAPPAEQWPSNAYSASSTSWSGGSEDLDHRARSYLDINCGHCHNPAGAADTSGLLLDYQAHASAALGVCKAPIAAGRGSGGFLYGIIPGNAEQSIMPFRMSTTNPATMMPELGRTLVHQEGLALITQWVNSMSGVCR